MRRIRLLRCNLLMIDLTDLFCFVYFFAVESIAWTQGFSFDPSDWEDSVLVSTDSTVDSDIMD